MYNRYIPQPDGSYRRNRIQDAQRSAPPQQAPAGTHDPPREPANAPLPKSNNHPSHRRAPSAPMPAGSFLRQLLPGNLDTEDLLVVVLLLLMAGDCEENRNTALLTLALYLFL